MAFKTATPTILSQVNWYEVENMHVLTKQQSIVLDCRRGYLADGETVPATSDIVSCTVSGADYAAALGTEIASGTTLGAAVVAAAYALLIASGTIPSDASPV